MLKLKGAVALLLVESDPKNWKKYLRMENRQYVIYVICNKAIYSTMNDALLMYKKLAKMFTDWGFTMNPFDPCVWNKDIGGKQFSFMFHIDDLLRSHALLHVVTLYIKKLKEEYDSNDPLSVTRGKVHEYLGICMKGEIALSQYDYIKKIQNFVAG